MAWESNNMSNNEESVFEHAKVIMAHYNKKDHFIDWTKMALRIKQEK